MEVIRGDVLLVVGCFEADRDDGGRDVMSLRGDFWIEYSEW